MVAVDAPRSERAATETTERLRHRSLMAEAARGRARILILDDDPDLVQVMKQFLEEHGDYEVETALTRRVDEVEANAPDVMIIDAQPGGKQAVLNFVQRLRLGSKVPSLPVLITATSMHNVDPLAARDARVHVLVKPYDGESLLRSLEGLLRPPGPGKGKRRSRGEGA